MGACMEDVVEEMVTMAEVTVVVILAGGQVSELEVETLTVEGGGGPPQGGGLSWLLSTPSTMNVSPEMPAMSLRFTSSFLALTPLFWNKTRGYWKERYLPDYPTPGLRLVAYPTQVPGRVARERVHRNVLMQQRYWDYRTWHWPGKVPSLSSPRNGYWQTGKKIFAKEPGIIFRVFIIHDPDVMRS